MLAMMRVGKVSWWKMDRLRKAGQDCIADTFALLDERSEGFAVRRKCWRQRLRGGSIPLFSLRRAAFSSRKASKVERLLEVAVGRAAWVQALLLHRRVAGVVNAILAFHTLALRFLEEEMCALTEDCIDLFLSDTVV